VTGAPTATDIADLIARQGTVYLLGREDPYASAAPLMATARVRDSRRVLDVMVVLPASMRAG